MNNPTQVAPQFLVVGFGRSFIGVTMRKSAIAVQEISSGIAAAGDRGYNGLEFPRSATAATKERTARVRRGRRERSARNTNLMHIELDDLSRPQIAELLKEHGEHVCACAADRRFTQPGHYFLECLGKR